MSDVDWTLYADGVRESLNRATTVEHAARVAADGMAYALSRPGPTPLRVYLDRCDAADRIADTYRATITRLTEDGPR